MKYSNKLQLQHMASGKFLTIDASGAALSEGQCMGVHAESGGASSHFTLLSKLKSRGDGAVVCFGHPVVFWHGVQKVSLHESKLLPEPNSALDWNSYLQDSCELNAMPGHHELCMLPYRSFRAVHSHGPM